MFLDYRAIIALKVSRPKESFFKVNEDVTKEKKLQYIENDGRLRVTGAITLHYRISFNLKLLKVGSKRKLNVSCAPPILFGYRHNVMYVIILLQCSTGASRFDEEPSKYNLKNASFYFSSS